MLTAFRSPAADTARKVVQHLLRRRRHVWVDARRHQGRVQLQCHALENFADYNRFARLLCWRLVLIEQ